MSEFSRRDALKAMGAAAVSTAAGGLLGPASAQAANLAYKPEAGAQLRVLRWKRFVMEREQYEAWQSASLGYVQQPLKAYADTKFWKSDPILFPYRNVPALTRDNGYAGQLGTASAGAMADYIVVNMFAQAASGATSIKSAMEQAESRAKRYYR